MLGNRRIILGVTGGIAAYKAVELLRLFSKGGADVHVIMTRSAQEFVTPLTFQTLSGNRVHTALFNLISENEIGHISLSEMADLVVIAPATANIIGKIAGGIADDMLSTTVMATRAPVVVAPAMNSRMYANPFYRENEEKLKRSGYIIVPPEKGFLACGTEGEGKLAPVETIFEYAASALSPKDLAGETILVTAGATREEMDPVRFITNRSSGKMGYAIASAAARRGARVILVSGHSTLPPPCGVEFVSVESAEEMRSAVISRSGECDAIIKCAAVADYRPKERSPLKIKKNSDVLTLELVKNRDILAELGQMPGRPFLAGFAAETGNLEEFASMKLEEKKADLIVANDVSHEGIGFDSDDNRVLILARDGSRIELPLMPKTELAGVILDQVKSGMARRKAQKQDAG